MHPKYKRKAAKIKAAKAKGNAADDDLGDEVKAIQSRKFPGLSVPDADWGSSEKFAGEPKGQETAVDRLPESISMDSTLRELEAVAARKTRPSAGDFMGGEPEVKRRRNDQAGHYENGRNGDYTNGAGPSRGPAHMDTMGNRYGMVDRAGPSRRMDDRPVLYKIYDGMITNVRDFGAFVHMDEIQGRTEGACLCLGKKMRRLISTGLVHVSNITGSRVQSANELLRRNQRVKVKVMSIAGTKYGLSMKDVDQNTGADLRCV